MTEPSELHTGTTRRLAASDRDANDAQVVADRGCRPPRPPRPFVSRDEMLGDAYFNIVVRPLGLAMN